MKINLVMIVKNEERSIERCLSAVAPLVSDLVIVDTGSTDRTKEIVRKIGMHYGNGVVRLYDYEWKDDFSAARNFALEKSETDGEADYHLVLDADEYLQPCITRELYAFIRRMEEKYGKNWSGAIRRIDSFGGGEEARMTAIVRLLPAGIRYRGLIHEQPVEQGPCILTPLVAEHDGYLQKGKGERNLTYLRRAIEEAPEDPYLNYQMGITLRNLGKNGESLSYFENFYAEITGGRSQRRKEEGTQADNCVARENTTGASDPANGTEDVGMKADSSYKNQEQPSDKAGKQKQAALIGKNQEQGADKDKNQEQTADRDENDEAGSEYVADGILQYLYALKDDGTDRSLNRALSIVETESDRLRNSTDFHFYCALFYVELIKSNIQRYMEYLPKVEACYQMCLEIGEGDGMSGVVGTGSFLALYNLGLWYELNNQLGKAVSCYRRADEMGYAPAGERLKKLRPDG